MHAETLDAEFYRERARLCHTLAEAATAAKPIFSRLYFLARAYEQKSYRLRSEKSRCASDRKVAGTRERPCGWVAPGVATGVKSPER